MKIVRTIFLRQCNFLRRRFLRLFDKTVRQYDLMPYHEEIQNARNVAALFGTQFKMPSPSDLE